MEIIRLHDSIDGEYGKFEKIWLFGCIFLYKSYNFYCQVFNNIMYKEERNGIL